MPATSELRQHDRIRGKKHDSVPCFDVRRLRAGNAGTISGVRNACQETGFFFVDNTFAGADVIERTLAQMVALFSLDDADPRKQAIKVGASGNEQGWTPLYGELPYQPGTVAHVESFDCGRRPAPGSDDPPNRWPDLPRFRRDVRDCWDALSRVGTAVLDSLSRAAGLDHDFLATRCATQEMHTLRLLHYPQNEAPASDANVGIAAHTDFECMTLIMQTAPGLELLAADGSWYDVPRHDGRLVVMLDDMLEHWTNGRFRATGHRVRNTGRQRYSIVMFFAVDDAEVVAPLPEFVTAGNPAQYPAVRQRDHLAHELAQAARNREQES